MFFYLQCTIIITDTSSYKADFPDISQSRFVYFCPVTAEVSPCLIKGGCNGLVLKGDLRFLAGLRVAWRHQVPRSGRKRGVDVDIDAVVEYIESHAHSKTASAGHFKESVQSGGKFPV